MKIIVCGDIHGEFHLLNKLIEREHPDIILQCGDNAYYWQKDSIGKIKPQNTQIYFVPGNHEDWDLFENRVGRQGLKPVEIEPNIFMCPVGSTLQLQGKNILFVGGADSIDKDRRIPKLSWWEQEILTYQDWNFIDKNVKHVDIVISHTCPGYFKLPDYYKDKENDPTKKILNLILSKYHPSLWCFGHYHEFMEGRVDKTNWICLDESRSIDWWRYLII